MIFCLTTLLTPNPQSPKGSLLKLYIYISKKNTGVYFGHYKNWLKGANYAHFQHNNFILGLQWSSFAWLVVKICIYLIVQLHSLSDKKLFNLPEACLGAAPVLVSTGRFTVVLSVTVAIRYTAGQWVNLTPRPCKTPPMPLVVGSSPVRKLSLITQLNNTINFWHCNIKHDKNMEKQYCSPLVIQTPLWSLI